MLKSEKGMLTSEQRACLGIGVWIIIEGMWLGMLHEVIGS